MRLAHLAAVDVDHLRGGAEDHAGLAGVELVFLHVELRGDVLLVVEAFGRELGVPGELVALLVGDAGMDPLAGVVLHPRAGDAEGLVEDRVELVGVVGGGDAEGVAGRCRRHRDRRRGWPGRRPRTHRRSAAAAMPSFSSQSVRMTGCGRARRIDVEQVRVVRETVDVVRPERGLEVGRLLDPGIEVFEDALVGHLGVAALEVDQVGDVAAEQHDAEGIRVGRGRADRRSGDRGRCPGRGARPRCAGCARRRAGWSTAGPCSRSGWGSTEQAPGLREPPRRRVPSRRAAVF